MRTYKPKNIITRDIKQLIGSMGGTIPKLTEFPEAKLVRLRFKNADGLMETCFGTSPWDLQRRLELRMATN